MSEEYVNRDEFNDVVQSMRDEIASLRNDLNAYMNARMSLREKLLERSLIYEPSFWEKTLPASWYFAAFALGMAFGVTLCRILRV